MTRVQGDYQPSHRKPLYQDLIAQLTLLQHNERCDTCAWPSVCETDETCWHQETAQASEWQRTRLDLTQLKAGGHTK